jgi:hypothetical protein
MTQQGIYRLRRRVLPHRRAAGGVQARQLPPPEEILLAETESLAPVVSMPAFEEAERTRRNLEQRRTEFRRERLRNGIR